MEGLVKAFGGISDGAARFADFLAIGRELKIVRPLVAKLNTEECRYIHTVVQRHLDRNERPATRTDAFQRIRSMNAPLRIAGLAQWLVATYFDTRSPKHETTELRHQDVNELLKRVRMRANPPTASGVPSINLRGYAA